MADAVTLEDLQAVYKRLQALEAVTKELARLEKIDTEFTSDVNKNLMSIQKDGQGAVNKVDDRVDKLDKRVTYLEKKTKK